MKLVAEALQGLALKLLAVVEVVAQEVAEALLPPQVLAVALALEV